MHGYHVGILNKQSRKKKEKEMRSVCSEFRNTRETIYNPSEPSFLVTLAPRPEEGPDVEAERKASIIERRESRFFKDFK